MPEAQDECLRRLRDLVTRFEEQAEAYHAGRYNETQVRREFIDPLFALLGWDVANTQGHAEQYKDVIHEDSLKVGGITKAPDYCFRVGGTRKFFVEAKKPAVNVREDVSAAYQVRRYAWSAKLPLSILTDFEEFAVYDCRRRPERSDSAATARILYLTCGEYEARWDKIAGVFSREAVLKGSFDRYAEATKGKRGTAEMDAVFLAEIEAWRDALARNFALRNPSLTVRELNVVVQRTIDRLIFLRICEDRGIEVYGQLQGLLNGNNTYSRLCTEYRRADDRYNSGLFHFHAERGRTDAPDALSLQLTLDDRVVKDIVKRLYYPDSPYEFSVFPADILGQVYEQFLGKVIRLTAGHQAKVEEKPEVKKAGGVYYTPGYIVDYIVRQTVGMLVEGRTPAQVADLRILDPACGSGSFLIGAYQYLLDWHLRWYLADGPERHAKAKSPALVATPSGGWRLATAERKRILLNNLYGVDIDAQAVEVTKLSLLLKVLEGETSETLNTQLSLLRERVLPDLAANIKCGNSLIGPDFYDGRQMTMLDEEEMHRINVFDWQSDAHGFGAIMRAGGFDAVIGNPPYIRIQTLKEWAPVEVEHYKRRYRAAGKGNYDIYVVFVERGLSLLNSHGLLGLILPHKCFTSEYGAPLREIISEGKHLAEMVHFGHQQVFPAATTYTCLLFLATGPRQEFAFSAPTDLPAWRSGIQDGGSCAVLKAPPEGPGAWSFGVGMTGDAATRLLGAYPRLGDVCDVFVGVQTSADDVYILKHAGDAGDDIRLSSQSLEREWGFEPGLVRPIVSGTDIRRYAALPARQYVLFPYTTGDVGTPPVLVTWEALLREFPRTAAYLAANRPRLEGRERGRVRGPKWYGFVRLQNMARQSFPKVCVPRLVQRLHAALDADGTRCLDNVDVGGVVYKAGFACHDLRFLTGLLNSSLLAWMLPFVSAPFRGGWLSANKQFLGNLPLRVIDFADPVDVACHDEVVALVQRLLDLPARLAAARTDQEKTVLQRQIDATDRQIDARVYALYGLTDEEIALVEGR